MYEALYENQVYEKDEISLVRKDPLETIKLDKDDSVTIDGKYEGVDKLEDEKRPSS